jgi:hypothetical protein
MRACCSFIVPWRKTKCLLNFVWENTSVSHLDSITVIALYFLHCARVLVLLLSYVRSFAAYLLRTEEIKMVTKFCFVKSRNIYITNTEVCHLNSITVISLYFLRCAKVLLLVLSYVRSFAAYLLRTKEIKMVTKFFDEKPYLIHFKNWSMSRGCESLVDSCDVRCTSGPKPTSKYSTDCIICYC